MMIKLHFLHESRLLIMIGNGLLYNSYTNRHKTTSISSGHFLFPFLKEVCSSITMPLNAQIGFSVWGMCFIKPNKKNSCRWVSWNSQGDCWTNKLPCEQGSSQITRTLIYLLKNNVVETCKYFLWELCNRILGHFPDVYSIELSI